MPTIEDFENAVNDLQQNVDSIRNLGNTCRTLEGYQQRFDQVVEELESKCTSLERTANSCQERTTDGLRKINDTIKEKLAIVESRLEEIVNNNTQNYSSISSAVSSGLDLARQAIDTTKDKVSLQIQQVESRITSKENDIIELSKQLNKREKANTILSIIATVLGIIVAILIVVLSN